MLGRSGFRLVDALNLILLAVSRFPILAALGGLDSYPTRNL